MIYDQREFQLRFEWGPQGIEHLVPISDSVVIVDVLTFSTAVVVAAARGATVFPYRWNDDSTVDIAVFETTKSHLPDTLRDCASGKELIEWGFEDDIEFAARLNSDDVAPRLRDRASVDDAA